MIHVSWKVSRVLDTSISVCLTTRLTKSDQGVPEDENLGERHCMRQSVRVMHTHTPATHHIFYPFGIFCRVINIANALSSCNAIKPGKGI